MTKRKTTNKNQKGKDLELKKQDLKLKEKDISNNKKFKKIGASSESQLEREDQLLMAS